MKQRPTGRTSSSEKIIRDIKRNTRKQYSAKENIRIVLDGCQRRSKTSPPGRSKTSPLNVMRYAVLGGCPGSP